MGSPITDLNCLLSVVDVGVGFQSSALSQHISSVALQNIHISHILFTSPTSFAFNLDLHYQALIASASCASKAKPIYLYCLLVSGKVFSQFLFLCVRLP